MSNCISMSATRSGFRPFSSHKFANCVYSFEGIAKKQVHVISSAIFISLSLVSRIIVSILCWAQTSKTNIFQFFNWKSNLVNLTIWWVFNLGDVKGLDVGKEGSLGKVRVGFSELLLCVGMWHSALRHSPVHHWFWVWSPVDGNQTFQYVKMHQHVSH